MNASMKGALLLIPILVLGGLSLLHQYHRSTGTIWTVPIEGYDPRDLLSGHYLQFRYAWNIAPESSAASCVGADCALCTADPAPYNPSVIFVPRVGAPAMCASFINGRLFGVDPGDRFVPGDRNDARYYIPESDAGRLQRLLTRGDATSPQFSIGLRVTDGGIAYIEAMYVDGVPLEQWLRAN